MVGIKRLGSVKSRKVSTQSLQSTASAEDSVLFVNLDDTSAAAAAAAGPDTAGDEGQDIQTDMRDTAGDELDYCRNMSWLKVPSYVRFWVKKYDGAFLSVNFSHVSHPSPNESLFCIAI